MRYDLTAALAAALLLTPAAAGAESPQDKGQAAPQRQLSAREQAMLDALPYGMRQYVVSRMGPEQKVAELVETTLLNRLANPEYKALRNVVVVYRAEALRPSGEWTAVEIDPVTYAIVQPAEPPRTGDRAAGSPRTDATTSPASVR